MRSIKKANALLIIYFALTDKCAYLSAERLQPSPFVTIQIPRCLVTNQSKYKFRSITINSIFTVKLYDSID
jgi:hypothetical protein